MEKNLTELEEGEVIIQESPPPVFKNKKKVYKLKIFKKYIIFFFVKKKINEVPEIIKDNSAVKK